MATLITNRKLSTPGTKSNMMRASTQWSERPADERFWSVDELITATQKIDKIRTAITMPVRKLHANFDDTKGLTFEGGELKKPTALTHWASNLLFARIGAPARYLRSLPGNVVAQLVNHGLKNSPHWDDKYECRLSLRNDTFLPHIEAFTSDRYGYIPNWKVGEGLKGLLAKGWQVPPARPAGKKGERTRIATKEDVLLNSKFHGLGVKVGDAIAPAGLYASDHDMFCFLVNEKQAIETKGFNLNRGIWVENSEVGGGAFRITTFLYDAVCGNHIVWGASDVTELAVRHIGKAEARAVEIFGDKLTKLTADDTSKTAKIITSATKHFLGKNRDEVVEAVYNHRRCHLSQENAGQAFDLAEKLDAKRCDPTTVWGMVCGVTRLSQELPNADDRVKMDAAASALMSLVSLN